MIQHSWTTQDSGHRRCLGCVRENKCRKRTGTKSVCLLQYTPFQIGDEARMSKPQYSPAMHQQLSKSWQRSFKSLASISLEKTRLPLLSMAHCTGLSDPPAGKSQRHQIYRADFFLLLGLFLFLSLR